MKKLGRTSYLLICAVLGLLLSSCGATPFDVVPAGVVGTWHGQCEIRLPVVFNPNQVPEGVERTRTTVDVEITIHEDATVEGQFGEATLQDSVIKQNRSDLGRQLKIANDYIIIDGHLSGPLVSGHDENDSKSFTVPFNVVDGHMKGSLMWREELKYPYPLCEVDFEQGAP